MASALTRSSYHSHKQALLQLNMASSTAQSVFNASHLLVHLATHSVRWMMATAKQKMTMEITH